MWLRRGVVVLAALASAGAAQALDTPGPIPVASPGIVCDEPVAKPDFIPGLLFRCSRIAPGGVKAHAGYWHYLPSPTPEPGVVDKALNAVGLGK